MRTFACLIAVFLLPCWNATTCSAQQQPGPATLENLLDTPARLPLKPPARDSDGPFPPVVPDATAVKKAQDLIKQAYEDDYMTAAKNPEPLIQKLLAAAGQTKDPIRKYAYLISAEEAAVAGGDYGRTMELIDIRTSEFLSDGIRERIERLAEFLTPMAKKDSELLARLYEYAIETAERGVKQDSLEQAKAAAEMAASIAKSIYMMGKAKKNDGVADDGEAKQAQARSLVKELDRRAGLFAEYKKALENIKAQEDPEANGVIGRYLCFEMDDWEQGLPFLAKGDQKDLAELAAQELKVVAGGKPDAREVFALAGQWWEITTTDEARDGAATRIRAHAGKLYASLEGKLTDPLDQKVAQKRRAEGTQVATRQPFRKAARDVQLASTQLVGGEGGGNFADELPEGAVLVGVAIRAELWVDAIQPIYRLKNGELSRGVRHGGGGGTEKIFELMPGEHIQGISGHAGKYVGSIRFHTNKRVSGVYGRGQIQGRNYEVPLPKGTKCVGFTGRCGGYLDALGLRYLVE